jgi:hypothetical protein
MHYPKDPVPLKINITEPGEALTLTPTSWMLAAVESATSASALSLDRCRRMNGHDAAPHVRGCTEAPA